MKTKIQYGVSAVALLALMSLAAGAQQSSPASSSAKTIQADSDHITIPLSHPGQPATLKVSLLMGSITVKGASSAKDIVVDVSGAGDTSWERQRGRGDDAEAQGMHRLNPSPNWSAEEDNNVVTIRSTTYTGSGNLTIEVPVNTVLALRTTNGGLMQVGNIDADVDLVSTNGRIVLDNVGGSIVATANNGRVTGTISHLSSTKPSSITSNNGTIDVTLPGDAKATLSLRSDQGSIYMDDNFKFETISTSSPSGGDRDSAGMYRVVINRTIRGNLNGGGPELNLRSLNGSIYVRRAK